MTTEHNGHHDSCANRNVKNFWFIGIVVLALVSLFCFALFSQREKIPSLEEMPQVMAMPEGQQAAFVPPACARCPTVTNCFPGATPAQLAAFVPPGCVNCPTVTNCFPNATPPAQQAAFTGRVCPVAFTQPTAGAAPVIFRDALMPHEYRGVCELCHVVQPDIAISINAQMPHVYRGVCSNCHMIQGLNQGVRL